MSSPLKGVQPGDVCSLRYSMTQSVYDALETATKNLDIVTQKEVLKFIRKMTGNLRAKTGPRPCIFLKDERNALSIALMATFEGGEFEALHDIYRKYCIPIFPAARPNNNLRRTDTIPIDDTPLVLTPVWSSGSKAAWVFAYPISIPRTSRLSRWTKRNKWGVGTQWHVEKPELTRFTLVTDATERSFAQNAVDIPKMVVDFAVSQHAA